MNAQAGSRSWLCLGLQASALAAAASAGFLLAAQPPRAAADGPLPTTSVTSLPVTLPIVSLPSLTSTTTTPSGATSASTTTDVSSPPAAAKPATATASASAGGNAETAIPGALRLPNGSVSIPVTSVRPPNRLMLAVAMAPRTLQGPNEAITANVLIREAHGYLVRGATVAIRSIPTANADPVAPRRSTTDGRAAFLVRARAAVLRKSGRLSLLVTAADPARLNAVAASRAVTVPIRPRSR